MAYWIFQGSGSFFLVNYFYDKYVRNHPDMTDHWHTGDYSEKVSKDDIAFIWKAALEPDEKEAPKYFQYKGYKKLQKIPGIYAIAKIIKPKIWSSIYKLDGPSCYTCEFYAHKAKSRDEMKAEKWWAQYKCIFNMVDKPLPQQLLWEYRWKKNHWIRQGLDDLWTTMRFTSLGIYPVSYPQAKIIKKLILNNNGLTVP